MLPKLSARKFFPLISAVLMQLPSSALLAQVSTGATQADLDFIMEGMRNMNNVPMNTNRWRLRAGDIDWALLPNLRRFVPNVAPARAKFIDSYEAMNEHLANARMEEANHELDQLFAFKDPNEYEKALLAMRDFNVTRTSADPETLLLKLQVLDFLSVTAGGIVLFPDEVRAPYLRLGFMLALELKYYREAMHFQEVMLRMEDKSYADEFAVAYSHLMEIAGDDSTYGVNVTIGDSGVWDMQLLKRNFYLDAVDGELQDFRLLCGNTQAKLAAEPLLSYSMPAEQTLCNVQVSGTSGTRFVLVQF